MMQRLGQLWRHEATRRYVGTVVPTATALALQFLGFIITARGLGVDALGQYVVLQGLAAIGAELVSVGTADTLVRAVSRDKERHSDYFGHMLLMICLALLPVVSLLSWVAIAVLKSSLAIPLVFIGILGEVIASRFAFSVEMTMVAHRDTVAAGFVRFSASFLRMLTAIVYFQFSSDLNHWIYAVLAQGVLIAAVSVGAAWWRYGRPYWKLQVRDIPIGLTFGVNQVAVQSQNNLDRLVLSRFASDAAVGAYAAGARVLQVGLFPITIMTRILYPQFFVEGAKGIAFSRKLALRNLPIMIGVGVFSSLSVVAVAMLLPAVLGPDFLKSRSTAMLLSLALPIIGTQYLAADTLTGAGFQKLRASIYVFTSLSFGLVLVLGARIAEATGVIVAFLSAHALLAILLWTLAFTVSPKPVPAPEPAE